MAELLISNWPFYDNEEALMIWLATAAVIAFKGCEFGLQAQQKYKPADALRRASTSAGGLERGRKRFHQRMSEPINGVERRT